METTIKIANQCCGKLDDNTRCQNAVLGNSKHCANHYSKAKKLYKSYKKVCETAKKFDINKTFDIPKETIDYLSKYHNLLNKGLEARLIHRDYAFALECHDKGHDYQFKFLNRKMQLCESKLGDLYNIETKINKIDEITEIDIKQNILKGEIKKVTQEKSKNELSNKKKISNKIKKIKKYIDPSVNEMMIKHKKENEQKQKDLLLIQNLIFNQVIKLFGLEKTLNPKCIADMDNIYMLCISVHRLMKVLNSIDFFGKDFEGYRLFGDKEGNEYLECMSVNICLGRDITNKKKIKPYFDNFSIDDLKKFYESILFKQNKIKHLIMDIKKLYCIFGINLLWTSSVLTWDVYKKRVVFEQNCDTDTESESESNDLCCCKECAERLANGEQFMDSSDDISY